MTPPVQVIVGVCVGFLLGFTVYVLWGDCREG